MFYNIFSVRVVKEQFIMIVGLKYSLGITAFYWRETSFLEAEM